MPSFIQMAKEELDRSWYVAHRELALACREKAKIAALLAIAESLNSIDSWLAQINTSLSDLGDEEIDWDTPGIEPEPIGR